MYTDKTTNRVSIDKLKHEFRASVKTVHSVALTNLGLRIAQFGVWFSNEFGRGGTILLQGCEYGTYTTARGGRLAKNMTQEEFADFASSMGVKVRPPPTTGPTRVAPQAKKVRVPRHKCEWCGICTEGAQGHGCIYRLAGDHPEIRDGGDSVRASCCWDNDGGGICYPKIEINRGDAWELYATWEIPFACKSDAHDYANKEIAAIRASPRPVAPDVQSPDLVVKTTWCPGADGAAHVEVTAPA